VIRKPGVQSLERVFLISGHSNDSRAKAPDYFAIFARMEKKTEIPVSGRQIVMSGIRPTGYLHLGNYFGALRNYVRMQEQYDCYFMVADWHSLTTHPDTKELKNSVLRVLAENIAACMYKAIFPRSQNYTWY
jgi:hypothetical protein